MIPALLGRAVVESAAGDLLARAAAEATALHLRMSVEADVRRLEELRGKAGRVAVIRAAQRAAKPVRAAVVASAQAVARYGFLARSVGTKAKLYPGGGFAVVVGPKMSFSRTKGKYTRGPRAGEGKKQVPYLYAWLLEKGTRRSAPKKFLAPAYAAEGASFPARAAREIAAELADL